MGCDYIQEEIDKDREKTKENEEKINMVLAPEVCNELRKTFTGAPFGEDQNNFIFKMRNNELNNGYTYEGYTADLSNQFNCRAGSKVGENVNHRYCEDIRIIKRETDIDEDGVIRKDTLKTYVIKDMILKFSSFDNFNQVTVHEVVERSCYLLETIDY